MQMWKKIAKNLITSFGGSRAYWVGIIPQVMAQWGKVCFGNGGDLI